MQGHVPSAPPAPTFRTPPRRRPTASMVVCALLLLALALTAWWGRSTLETGRDWRDVALAEEERAERAEEIVADLSAERDGLQQQLSVSEDDVATLELRIADLASEKAGAEDSAALANEVARELASLSQRGAEVGADLRSCIAQTTDLTNDILTDALEDDLNPAALNRRIDEVNERCEDAEDDYLDLVRDLDALNP